MNSFIYKTHAVPDDLSTVITIDSSQEVAPKKAGISIEGVQAIWDSVLDMYRTGVYPGISVCLRRRGKVVLKRANWPIKKACLLE
jgi:CubicO group peptidase (beta-lactamase class C family)